MAEQLGRIVDSGIDYISMTLLNTNVATPQWERAAQAHLELIAVDKQLISMTRRLGYDGWAFGGSFVGRRERDTISIFSGERAKEAFSKLYRADCHVSRLDVQTSFQYRTATTNVAEVVRNQVIRDNARIGKARQRNATLIEDLRGGATCYVGQRVSEQFARIYNKEAESGDKAYERVWRFEVQLKNRLAAQVAEQFARNPAENAEQSATFVKHWLRHRGVSTPWTAAPEIEPLPTDRQKATQLDDKLRWLREQVRPALRVLLKYGLRDDILLALGLTEEPDSAESGD